MLATIEGRVINPETKQGIAGLRVQALRVAPSERPVGNARTGPDGSFRIELPDDVWESTIPDRERQVFFRVYYQNQRLVSTEDTLRWNPFRIKELAPIKIDWSPPTPVESPQAPPDAEGRLVGQVVDQATGSPLPGYTVRVAGSTAGSDSGRAVTTGDRGLFELEYTPAATTGPLVKPLRAAEHKVRLEVLDPQGRSVQTTEVPIRSGGHVLVPIPVPLPTVAGFVDVPLGDVAQDLDLHLPPALLAALENQGIHTLEDVRNTGGLGQIAGLRDPEWASATAALEAHALLSILPTDARTNAALLNKGYTSPMLIADAPEALFTTALQGVVDEQTAQTIHAVATAQTAFLGNMAADQMRPGYGVAAVSSTLPCSCRDCQNAVSPLAYLADLLRYTLQHLRDSQGGTLDLNKLSAALHQPFGDFPADCSLVDAQVLQVRLCIEVLVRYIESHLTVIGPGGIGAGNLRAAEANTRATRSYLGNAYQALLLRAGTSYDELRLARTAPQDRRQALAARLGIDLSHLSELLLDSGSAPGVSALNMPNLERLFGLPDFTRNPLSDGPVLGDSSRQIDWWSLQGIQWAQTTDMDGTIYVSLQKAGAPLTVTLYADQARTRAIATATDTSGAAPVTLPLWGAQVSGAFKINYQQDVTAGDFGLAAFPRLVSWRLTQLARNWQAEDWAPKELKDPYPSYPDRPVIDPDLISDRDVQPSPKNSFAIDVLRVWNTRRQWIADQITRLGNNSQGRWDLLIKEMQQPVTYPPGNLRQPWQLPNPKPIQAVDLLDLRKQLRAGDPSAIETIVKYLHMTISSFTRLTDLLNAGTGPAATFSVNDQDEIISIMVQATKATFFDLWIYEESLITGIDLLDPRIFRLASPTDLPFLGTWRAPLADRQKWQEVLRLRSAPPLIDPDVIGPADFARPEPGDPAFTLWQTRANQVATWLGTLRSGRQAAGAAIQSWFNQALSSTLGLNLQDPGQPGRPSLLEIEQKRQQGEDIRDDLAQLSLTPAAFDRIMYVNQLITDGAVILSTDWDEIDAILVQVQKAGWFAVWHDAEANAGITLNPIWFQVQPPDADPPALPPWRATWSVRNAWETRLQARVAAQQQIIDEWHEAIRSVEQAVLPSYRDQLLGVIPLLVKISEDPARWFADQLLIATDSSGCQMTTRAEQAIETLQTLLWSLRTGAADNLPFALFPDLGIPPAEGGPAWDFDSEWKWMGSYATWRAAMLVFLYPENVLLPGLVRAKSPEFTDIIENAHALTSASDACAAADKYGTTFLQDINALDVQATCELVTPVLVHPVDSPPDACGAGTPVDHVLLYMFALGKSGLVYWSVYDANDASQSFWYPVTGTSHAEDPDGYWGSKVTAIVGAVPHQRSDGTTNDYIYLIVQTHLAQTNQDTLMFAALDVTSYDPGQPYTRWPETPQPLPRPNNQDIQSAVAQQCFITPADPPRVIARANSGALYEGIIDTSGGVLTDQGWQLLAPETSLAAAAVDSLVAWIRLDLEAGEWKTSHSYLIARGTDGHIKYKLLGYGAGPTASWWDKRIYIRGQDDTLQYTDFDGTGTQNFTTDPSGVKLISDPRAPTFRKSMPVNDKPNFGQVYIRGTDNAVYSLGSRNWRTAPASWQKIQGNTASSAPSACTQDNDILDYVFVRLPDGSLGVHWDPPEQWQTWPINLASAPAATAKPFLPEDGFAYVPLEVDVFGLTPEHAIAQLTLIPRSELYHQNLTDYYLTGGQPWSFLPEDPGGPWTSGPAACWINIRNNEGELHVFARGADYALWHTYFDTQWHPWESLGGQLTSDPFACADPTSDRIDVFVRGTDGQVYQITKQSSSWSPWNSRGGKPSIDKDDSWIDVGALTGETVTEDQWIGAFQWRVGTSPGNPPGDDVYLLYQSSSYNGAPAYVPLSVLHAPFAGPCVALYLREITRIAPRWSGIQGTLSPLVVFTGTGSQAGARRGPFFPPDKYGTPPSTTLVAPYFGNQPILSELTDFNLDQRRRNLESYFAASNPSMLPGAYLAEAYYYVPIYLALALDAGGQYEAALGWFRTVYDYSQPAGQRKIYPGLKAEESLASLYDRPADWLKDPLNPHAIAATRRNTYTRFTIVSEVRCILDYADAEFALDSPESLARARTLALLALRLLDSEDLKQPEICADEIGGITVTVGDEWKSSWNQVKQDLFEITSPDALRETITKVTSVMASDIPTSQGLQQAAQIVRQAIAASASPQTVATVLESDVRRRETVVQALLAQQEVAKAVGSIPGKPQLKGTSGSNPYGQYAPTLSYTFCVPENPVLAALRQRAESVLFKLRNCLNIAGMQRQLALYAAPTTLADVAGTANQLVVQPPTPYRYSTLIERAKQLVQLATQLEASMLSAIAAGENAAYQLLQAEQTATVLHAQLQVQSARVAEAEAGVQLASLQQRRAQTQIDHYQGLLDRGLLQSERDALDDTQTAEILQTFVGTIGIAATLATLGLAGPAASAAEAGASAAAASSAASQSSGIQALQQLSGGIGAFSQAASSAAQYASMSASFERRQEDWTLQRDMGQQDLAIALQQVVIAQDNVAIAQLDFSVGQLQARQADDVVHFLQSKFASTDLYNWMSNVLEDVYRYFLRQATAVAQLAAGQLAFERQTPLPPYIQADYWQPQALSLLGASAGAAASNTNLSTSEPDSRGLTGAERLLQDIYQLDQFAFQANQRKLQLTKTLSLAQLDPFQVQQFRETGILRWATPMDLFDRDFPGHYLRLIRRVRLSVIALIPPNQGIRATLTTAGTSRVIVHDQTFHSITLQRDPEVVALSGAVNATGVFDLDPQSELLLPFEGIGVDTSWELRMPKAANPFDYDAIADVLLTIEYTALNDPAYAQQVVRQLGNASGGDRAFSFKQDFADAWYDLQNVDPQAQEIVVTFVIDRSDFPPNLDDLQIAQLLLYFQRRPGETRDIQGITLQFSPDGALVGGSGLADTVNGLVTTRNSSGADWLGMRQQPPFGTWKLTLPQSAFQNSATTQGMLQNTDDILFVITYSGQTPDWAL